MAKQSTMHVEQAQTKYNLGNSMIKLMQQAVTQLITWYVIH
jgi:hypothetical protein